LKGRYLPQGLPGNNGHSGQIDNEKKKAMSNAVLKRAEASKEAMQEEEGREGGYPTTPLSP